MKKIFATVSSVVALVVAAAAPGHSQSGTPGPVQPAQPAPADAPPKRGAKTPAAGQAPAGGAGERIEKLSGVWVEGGGFDIKYGGDYDSCAKRCLDNSKCLMIEYYYPQKKCNMYDTERPRLKGGSSFVGIKRGPGAEPAAALR